MMTPFQHKKQVHYFNMLDADKDGQIDQSDFEDIGHRLATVMGIQPGDEAYPLLRAGIMEIWNKMEPEADASKDGRVSLDEFLKFETRVIFDATPEEFDAYIGENNRGLAALGGGDHTSLREWRWFFHGFRLDESRADECFQRIDTNGDGKISVDEMIEAVRQFHLSDDPGAPGNWVFGPLAD